MIPQNSQHSTSSVHLRQQIRARLDESGSSLPPAQIFLEQWYCHEIAGHHHQVRIQSIDNVDRFANRDYRKMFVVMEIAHLRDSDSIPGVRANARGELQSAPALDDWVQELHSRPLWPERQSRARL